MEDECLVYSSPKNYADFYYKNKKLHREAGPAVVIFQDSQQYSFILDKEQYVLVTEPVVEQKNFMHMFHNQDGEVKYIEKIFQHTKSCYYLNGVQYEKQEFDAIMLSKELKNKENKNSDPKNIENLKINNMKKDNYILYVEQDGTKLYYKNKKLHREDGPAMVVFKDIEESNLEKDDPIYLKVNKPLKYMEKHTKVFSTFGVLTKGKAMLCLFSSYWLEGEQYSKEEFNDFIIRRNLYSLIKSDLDGLSRELNNKLRNSKRVKI